MVDGQTGEPGVIVVWHVAVDRKHACAAVPILPQPMVGLTAKGVIPSPNLATRMGAQVSIEAMQTDAGCTSC